MKLTIDFESRSAVDLNEVGTWLYSRHPSTEVMCLGWSDGLVDGQWARGDPEPTDLFTLIKEADTVEAHSAFFERCIWLNVCVTRYGWAYIADHKWRCSMAKATSCALPRGLADAGHAARAAVKKDIFAGKKAMMRLTQPRKDGTFIEPADEPDTWAEMLAYNRGDVAAEEALSEALPDLLPREQAIFEMSERMNLRGIAIDVEGARKAVDIAAHHVGELVAEFEANVGCRPGQRAKFIVWLNECEVVVSDSQAGTLDKIIADPNIKADVRRACEIVRAVGRSSLSKYQNMLNRVDTDGRVRGCFLYHGANTGRWAGRDIQPHNFPKGNIRDQEAAWALVHDVAPDVHPLLHDPLEFLSGALRGVIWAPEGRQLYCADYAAIEARVTFWLAGEDLSVFEPGRDIYLDMASVIYGRKVTDTKGIERFLGKQSVLGLGFQMGFIKFLAHCRNLGAPKFTDQMVASVVPAGERNALARWIWEEAWPRVREMHGDVGKEILMELVLMKYIVDRYRRKYAKIVLLWDMMEKAARAAIGKPGARFRVNERISYKAEGMFLTCRLPSGRNLYYPDPEIKEGHVTHMRVDDRNQWVRMKTYGGRLCENAVQGIARDIMADAMIRCEQTPPYENIVLTVHDEIVCEVDENAGSLEEFTDLVSSVPNWALSMPVKAESWKGKRYKK